MGSGIVFPRNGLEQLGTIFGLHENTSVWDVVFVSFDLEPKGDHPKANMYNEIAQIGVLMLDTRSFSNQNPAGTIVTRHFVVGGHKRLMHSARQFHFGSSEHLDQDDVDEVILKLFHIPDEKGGHGHQKFRNIVLVGHGLRSDLLVLRKRGIMFEHLSTIIAKFDTTYIAKEVLGTNFQLHGLLRTLHCPYRYVHNAGNDANFTLRALLMLVYYGLRPCTTSFDEIHKLRYFKALALEELPDTTQRNARLAMPLCEDYTMNALDMGSIGIFDES